MAISSSTTIAQAKAQYLDNVEGWRGNVSKATSLIAAIEALLVLESQTISIAGRSISRFTLQKIRDEAAAYVASANTSRDMFSRTRVSGKGRW